jgi:hypothetical protein
MVGASLMQNPHAHFVIHLGADRFDVIVGCRLNEQPLSLADANRLARRSSASVVSVVGQLVGGNRDDRAR